MSAVSSPPITPAQLEARIGCRLPERSADGRARSAALMADTWSGRTPTSLVAYASAGSLAIIADRETGAAVRASIGHQAGSPLAVAPEHEVFAERPDRSWIGAERVGRAEHVPALAKAQQRVPMGSARLFRPRRIAPRLAPRADPAFVLKKLAAPMLCKALKLVDRFNLS